MSDENQVDLGGLFGALQKELCARQELVRVHVNHPGSKGDASEFNWIKVLSDYLPNRYNIEKAFVVDCEGNLSDQQDIVIFDQQYTPFILKKDGLIYVPSESVYTVIEAKQSINKQYIDYASKKAASVRRLRRTSVAIQHAGGQYKPKPPFHIPAGVATLSSDWNPPLGESFQNALLEHATSDQTRVEYGCVLDSGAFRLTGDASCGFEIVTSKEHASLMSFLLTLSHTLQQLATVPAIDVLAYAKWLE